MSSSRVSQAGADKSLLPGNGNSAKVCIAEFVRLEFSESADGIWFLSFYLIFDSQDLVLCRKIITKQSSSINVLGNVGN